MGAPTIRFAAWRWAAVAIAFGLAGSSSSHRSASAQPSTPPAATPPAATTATQAALPPPAQGEHGAGKRGSGANFNDTPVYVDGKAKGVLRYSEMPPTLHPFAMPSIDDLDIARYYRLYDYLLAIGVDLDKVREIQIYGSHDRVAVVSAAELKKQRDGVVFDFTRQVQGKPRAKWAQTHALRGTPMVDVIMAIAIYVAKKPPTFANGEMLIDGKEVDQGIPYVDDGVPKGTRVYVDGHLDGWVRRKLLPSKLIAPDSPQTHAKFSTDAFLAYVGADSHNVTAIDFYDGDYLLARVDGKAWASDKGAYVFDLPNRSHGQINQTFPGDRHARVTSVQLYIHTAPPSREVEPAAFEQQGGSDDSQNGGNGPGSGDGSGGNNGVTPAAQGVNNGSAPADNDEL